MKHRIFYLLTLGSAALALSGCTITSTSSRPAQGGATSGSHGSSGHRGWWQPVGEQPVGHQPAAHRPVAHRPVAHRPGAPSPTTPATPPPVVRPKPKHKPPKLDKQPKRPKLPHPKPPPAKPGGDKTKKPKPTKDDKPVRHPKKPKSVHPSMACVAAVKAAQSGLCEEALQLLEQCSGNQEKAATKNVGKHCALP
jgi:hypothetical protein